MAAIDLSDPDLICYAFRATLETAETVDGSIGLRSATSVYRVTRRIHATQAESTLFGRRAVCTFVIPLQATPTFITSGVSLNWTLRVEFVTPTIHITEVEDQRDHGDDDEDEDGEELELELEREGEREPKLPQKIDREHGLSLLEEISKDDRGSVFAAAETLSCSSFDVAIPLVVYGPVSDETGHQTSAQDGWPV